MGCTNGGGRASHRRLVEEELDALHDVALGTSTLTSARRLSAYALPAAARRSAREAVDAAVQLALVARDFVALLVLRDHAQHVGLGQVPKSSSTL
jgi:hypothetical protein